ncbi:MAG: Crp/Fnr family transcriptional regulator [Coleofasciculus sp. C1-SOL-03]|jgi:CRP-like cAMP-binding protein|uniref:Crp/Fnr family transcriptional regulator n=1 Tax=Coleofasciculus sp. C1-SOL-03 TaxID=3069522 RepID=UPI00330031F1
MSLSTSIPYIFPTRLHVVYPQKAFNRKDLLSLSSDYLWKIEQGIVRSLTWNEEGQLVTLGFWGPGDVVGRRLSRIKPYQVVCLTRVQASQIPLESQSLPEALLIHAWKSEELLNILHQHSAYARLLHLLEWLSCQFGQTVPQGKLLNFHLTHQDIAETIGTTRVTVTRLINRLEQEGRIVRSRRNLILTTGEHSQYNGTENLHLKASKP